MDWTITLTLTPTLVVRILFVRRWGGKELILLHSLLVSPLLPLTAKYPCLQLRSKSSKNEKEQGGPVLHFGSVAVGQSLQKYFDIFNPSPVSGTQNMHKCTYTLSVASPLICLSLSFLQVTASFSLSRLSGGVPLLGSEFNCDITRGNVAPGGSLQATVTYTPAVVDTVSVEYLSLNCKGALNKTLLKLTGNCIGRGHTHRQTYNEWINALVYSLTFFYEKGKGIFRI